MRQNLGVYLPTFSFNHTKILRYKNNSLFDLVEEIFDERLP